MVIRSLLLRSHWLQHILPVLLKNSVWSLWVCIVVKTACGVYCVRVCSNSRFHRLVCVIITIIGRFYIALFSALEQTHYVFQHTCGWFMCWLVCVTLNVRFQYPLVQDLCMTWVLLQWHRLCIHFICPQVNGLSVFWTVFAEHIFLSFFSAYSPNGLLFGDRCSIVL